MGAWKRPKTPQKFKFVNDSVDLCRISRLNDGARVKQKACWEMETIVTWVNISHSYIAV